MLCGRTVARKKLGVAKTILALQGAREELNTTDTIKRGTSQPPMTDYEIALIAGGFGIAGTLLGVFFTYRLSLKVADQQFQHLKVVSKLDARHVAEQNFVAAFSEEHAALLNDEELSIPLDDYLRRAYHAKHKIAITTFRHFLEADLRASFDAACYEYHSGKITEDMIETGIPKREAMFMEYMGHPFGGNPYEKARTRLSQMLSFAGYE